MSQQVVRCALLLCLVIPGSAPAGSTIDATNRHAYGANVGWIDARADGTHGAAIGHSYCTGYVYAANVGWIGLGNGPTNGWRYGNASAADWGVNHDGEGRLNGYAYGANAGWVKFEQTWGQPRVDLRTGNLSGYAWGANLGWIGLANARAYVRTETLDPGLDSDSDLLPDPYEYAHTNTLADLSGLAGHDADGDGATDLEEAGADTDPLNDVDLLRIVSVGVEGATNRVAWTGRPTRLYRLEATNTLTDAAGGWADAGPGLLGPPTLSCMTQTVSDVIATTRFYRVHVVVPLSEQDGNGADSRTSVPRGRETASGQAPSVQ
jgi:hypothetical protein